MALVIATDRPHWEPIAWVIPVNRITCIGPVLVVRVMIIMTIVTIYILIMMTRVILMMCMGLLNRLSTECGMVFMDRVALVGRTIRIGLDPVARSPVLAAHLDRMAPVIAADHPHWEPIARVTPLNRPTRTGPVSVNRSPMSCPHLEPDGTGNEDRQPPSAPDSRIAQVIQVKRTTRSSESIIGVIHKSGPIGPCDAHGSPPTGFVEPLCHFVCVYQPGPSRYLFR